MHHPYPINSQPTTHINHNGTPQDNLRIPSPTINQTKISQPYPAHSNQPPQPYIVRQPMRGQGFISTTHETIPGHYHSSGYSRPEGTEFVRAKSGMLNSGTSHHLYTRPERTEFIQGKPQVLNTQAFSHQNLSTRAYPVDHSQYSYHGHQNLHHDHHQGYHHIQGHSHAQPYSYSHFEYIPLEDNYIDYEQRQIMQQRIVPIRRKARNYYEIEHVTDYEPREYEQTVVDMVAEEKINQKIYYLPIQTHLVHFPVEPPRTQQHGMSFAQQNHYRSENKIATGPPQVAEGNILQSFGKEQELEKEIGNIPSSSNIVSGLQQHSQFSKRTDSDIPSLINRVSRKQGNDSSGPIQISSLRRHDDNAIYQRSNFMAKGQPSFTYQEENSATFMQKQPSFEENANEIKNSQPMFINVE